MKLLILVAILAIVLLAAVPVSASNVCPVCGEPVGYGTSITWQSWITADGHGHSGWILCCPNCGYTTCRDAMGNIPSPDLAQKAWKGKMFPWIYNGWTHQQYVENK